MEGDVLLGLASIPFTLALTTDPTSVRIAPVFVAAFVAGLYYEPRSRPAGSAGVRTGLVGGLPVVLPTVDIVLSELSAASGHVVQAVIGGIAWILLAFPVVTFGTVLCATLGGWLTRAVTGGTRGEC